MRILSILFFFDDKFSVKERKCGSCKRVQGYEKHERKRKTLRHKKRTRPGTSEVPKHTRQPGGSTENDDRPLFPPSGLNYYHPAEHCLLWRRIILLSLGRSSSNALREGLRERDEDRREGGVDGKPGTQRTTVQRPRFYNLLILRRKTTELTWKTNDNLLKKVNITS